MRSMRSDHGAGLLEYVGLVIVSCGVLVGLAQTSLGDDVVGACRTAICRITGGECAERASAAGTAGAGDVHNRKLLVPDGGGGPAPRKPTGRFCDSPTLNGRQPRIHSHNDYLRDHPLKDALDHKAQSVEADVWWDGGDINLRHNHTSHFNWIQGDKGDTKGRLGFTYIDELKKRVRDNGGRVYPDRDEPFVLNVELKDTDAYSQRKVFQKVLKQYRSLQEEVVASGGKPENVQVVFSGNEPDLKEWDRLAGGKGVPRGVYTDKQYSGSRAECDAATNADYSDHVRWVSLDWRACVSEDGQITPEEQDYLNKVARNAHRQGKELRTWGAPDEAPMAAPLHPGVPPQKPGDARQAAWAAQAKAGFDHIGTDHLTTLRDYLGTCA